MTRIILTYSLSGNPIPLARTRIKGNTCFDSQKTEKLIAGITIRNQHGSRPFYNGPLRLDVTFSFKIPKHKQRKIKLNDYHTSNIDLDNLLKFLCDVCNGILYKDDAIISEIYAKKIYAHESQTIFTLTEINKSEITHEA